MKLTFYWPQVESNSITKDIYLIPFILRKYYNYESKIITYYTDYHEDDKKYLGDIPIEVMNRDDEIEKYISGTDILMLVAYNDTSMQIAYKFKQINNKGIVFLKTDFNPFWLSRIPVDDNLKVNLGYIDIVTVESMYLLNKMNETWPCKVEYLTQGYFDFSYGNEKVKYEEKENVILTVARLGDYAKANEVLVNAFLLVAQQLPDWKLKMVGPCEPWFESYVSEIIKNNPWLDGRIELTGAIYDKIQLYKLYKEAKIFCLTSRTEGFPNVLPEAANNGCYIISSDLHFFNDISNFGAFGSSFQVDNVLQLSDVLIKNCTNENKLKAVCYGIQEYCDIWFNWIKHGEKLDSMIKNKLIEKSDKLPTEKLVSIIVLSYNRLDYIKKCIDSILSQVYSNIELIIADDHSDNFSKSDLESYINDNNKGNISNVIVKYNEENIKTVKSLNNAIKSCNGDYIMILSSDDLLYDNSVVSKITNFHEANPDFGASVGKIRFFKENPDEFYMYSPNPIHVPYICGNAIDCFKTLLLFRGSFFPSPGLCYKRETIEKYGLYDENYVLLEDLPRFLQLTRNGCRIGYIDSYLIRYRDGGISTNPDGNSNTINMLLENDMKRAKEVEMDPYMYLVQE